MRKALNENPLVQFGLLGLLALVVAVLMITRMGGGSAEPPADTSTNGTITPAPGSASADAAGATPAAAPATPATPATSGEAPAVVSDESGFTAGPGLPAKVADAYDAGAAVVVLIVHRKGIDDRKLAAEVGSATGVGDTALFVVQDKDIADYSRIAEGVDVDRVPALIVIEPKSRAGGAGAGSLPEASISYGYRGPESISQAVRDALYKGRDNLPYYPK